MQRFQSKPCHPDESRDPVPDHESQHKLHLMTLGAVSSRRKSGPRRLPQNFPGTPPVATAICRLSLLVPLLFSIMISIDAQSSFAQKAAKANLTIHPTPSLTPVLRTTLQKMIADAEVRLTDFATGSNFQQIISDVFGMDSVSESLRDQLISNGLQIKVEVRSNEEMLGHPAAYAAGTSDGTERIYLNEYWLSSNLMYSYLTGDLLHEVGHAIAHRLNADKKTAGDLGEFFSRTLNGEVFTDESLAAIQSEDSHAVLNIDGMNIPVECATVTFLKVYAGTGVSYTKSSSSISYTTPISGSSFKFTSANPADVSFSGNDVAGQFSYTSGGQSYIINGIVSRKVGNTTAFFFVETTVLGGNTVTGRAWLLTIPGTTFTDNSSSSTNSAPVGTDLNAFLSTQSTNSAPAITSNGGGSSAIVSLAENITAVTTVTATDANVADTKTYSISGGADASRFAVNASTGVLTFIVGPDYEIPTDAGLNNVYNVQVTVTDPQGATDYQDMAVSITNANDTAPVISSNGGGATATIPVTQGTTAVTAVTATDADAGDVLTFSISGGTNQALFAIDPSSGILTFIVSSVNGTYVVIVQVTDAVHNDTQTITVNVTETDLTPPSLVISGSDANLAAGETCTISFRFSEPVTGFVHSDIVVAGGTLGSLTPSGSDPTLYTAQFTQSGSGTAPSFRVAAGNYQDLNSNSGLASNTLTLSYDLVAPTVAVDIAGTDIAYGETRVVTFTFSENPGNTFSLTDISVTNGLLTNLLQSETPTSWTASLKSTSSTSGPSVTVTLHSYSDPSGNPGSSGTDSATLTAPSIDLANTTASDTGISSSDNITNNAKPVITGIAPSSDAVVTVTVTGGGVTYTYNNVAVSGGSWSLNLSTATVTSGTAFPAGGLPAGYVGLTVTGNTSTTTASSSFLIDLTAPAAPTVTAQTTVDATPTIAGTATFGDGDTFTVLINGVTYTGGDGYLSCNAGAGTWSLSIPTALIPDTYTATATATDAAGNSASGGDGITISPSTISIDLDNTSYSDTGTSSTDNITSNREPILTGASPSEDAAVTVTLISGGVTYTYNNVPASSLAWSLNLSTAAPTSVSPSGNFPSDGLPAGTVNLTVTGNTTGATASNSFVVLAPAPTLQASNLVFSTVQATQMTISWTNGNGEKRAVFVKDGTGTITNPSDNTTYTASAVWTSKGTQLGESGYYCVFNGNGNSITLTGLTLNTLYWVQVFEYNNPEGFEKYIITTATDNPKSQTTASACTNPTSGGTIAASQTGCNPFDPAAFTSSAAASGETGALEYKWQKSTTSGSSGFSDISSTNSATYDAAALTATTWYKRLARVDCMADWSGAAESNVLQITVNQPSFSPGTFTVANLQATGSGIKWYTAASGGTALASGDAISNGTTYYASQTINGIESTSRLAVTATIDPTPCAPTGNAAQSFVAGTTVASLIATGGEGSAIRWYAAAAGGTALASSTVLVHGTSYYASQTVGCTESAKRLAVTVTIIM